MWSLPESFPSQAPNVCHHIGSKTVEQWQTPWWWNQYHLQGKQMYYLQSQRLLINTRPPGDDTDSTSRGYVIVSIHDRSIMTYSLWHSTSETSESVHKLGSQIVRCARSLNNKTLPRMGRGGVWPLPRFFWWIRHSAQRSTESDNGPPKVITFPLKGDHLPSIS